MSHRSLFPALLLLAACSEAPAGNRAAAGPAKPFVPLSAAEIGAALPGHYVDQAPYACFDGPLLVLKDGTFDTMDQAGRTGGEYVIGNGRITFDNHGGPEHFLRVMLLYRDQKGALYFKYEPEDGDPRPAVLKAADPLIFETLCREEMTNATG